MQYNPITGVNEPLVQYNPITGVNGTLVQYNPITGVNGTLVQYNPITGVNGPLVKLLKCYYCEYAALSLSILTVSMVMLMSHCMFLAQIFLQRHSDGHHSKRLLQRIEQHCH